MSKKNKKGVKMALSDFLSDQNTGSWADEMADLPTAPATTASDQTRAPREFGFSRTESSVRPRNTDVELPTNPPFTAFFGNLSFSVSESQIEQFFSNQQISNVRLVKGMDGRSKGFAYVEFADVESLKSALDLHGNQLEGRPVHVDVAEQRPQREDKTSGVWRRDGPARPREEPKAFESTDTWRTGAPRAAGARSTGGFERRDPPSERQNAGPGRFTSAPKPASAADGVSAWRRPDGGAPRTTSAFKDSWVSKDYESKREDGERKEFTPRAPREPREFTPRPPRESREPRPSKASESEGNWRRT